MWIGPSMGVSIMASASGAFLPVGSNINVKNSAGNAANTATVDVVNPPSCVLPATVAMTSNTDPLAIRGADGTRNFGTVTAVVANGSLNLNLPSGSTIITNQTGAVNITDADGTSASGTATIASDGLMTFVGLPGNAALALNSGTVPMALFTGALNGWNGNFVVTGGLMVSVNLASPDDTIVSDGFSTSIETIAFSEGSDFARINVAGGEMTGVDLHFGGTKSVVTNGQVLTVPVTGTYTSQATLTVAGGSITGIVLS